MAGATREALLEPAFVLHGRDYRNSSLLLELLARDHGRVGVVARGARGPRSRTAGLLQPFQPLAVSWRARGDLGSLQAVESAGRAPRLTGRRLVSGFYANELLMRLLGREDPHPGLFERYLEYLEALAGPTEEVITVRAFERDLLAMLGYGLGLQSDVDGEPLVRAHWYRYDPDLGAVAVAGAQGAGVIVSGAILLDLALADMPLAVARASRGLMRAALAPHLGNRPLKSRELYARYPVTGDTDHGPPSGQS